MTLHALSDDELVRGLHALCVDERRLVARLLAHLIEIEDRGLDRKECSSLFVFCVKRLGMSEGSAYRRTQAASVVRRFPSVLGRIERGEIHLTSLVLLKPHLTEENVDELVTEASGKSKLEVQAILARRAPRPDVPSTIREIPAQAPALGFSSAPLPPVTPPTSRIEPLAPERHMVQLTISSEGRAMLERARDLMRHRNPSGDLGAVVESALVLLVQKLEKERLGKTTRVVRNDRATKKGYIAQSVRRDVFERDGERCTFVGSTGERCEETSFLELDHIVPRAKGGTDEAKNLRVTCRAHNLYYAEQIFGKDAVQLRQRKSPSTPVPPAPPPTFDIKMFELGMGALVNMGFREPDARRALDLIGRNDTPPPSIQDLLRKTLAILTQKPSPGPSTQPTGDGTPP